MINARDLIAANSMKEYLVKAILAHKKAKGAWIFNVAWSNGEVTWEPMANFMDANRDGGFVYNDKFLAYAKKNKIVLPERGQWSDCKEEGDVGDVIHKDRKLLQIL